MTDDLEGRLRRYRPTPPDATLRARVLAAARESRPVPIQLLDWGMIVTAAVLLLAAFGTAPSVTPSVPTAEEAAWTNNVVLVASMLDGDRARQVAEALVPRPEPALPVRPAW
jgi:hypothetical protein